MMSNKSIKVLMGCLIFGVFLNTANYFYSVSERGWAFIEPKPFAALLVKSGVTSKSFMDSMFLKPCPVIPSGLGPIKFNATQNSTHLHMTGKKHTVFLYGGYNKVVGCTPDSSVAVIVPIPASSQIPSALVSHLHVLLSKQLLESRMYVVQQCAGIYDPGRLFMAAFYEISRAESEKSHATQCFVLNEPRFVPVDTSNIYRCYSQPKQLVAAILDDDNDNGVTPFELTLGGACALSREHIVTMAQDTIGNEDWSYEAMAHGLLAANYTIEKKSTDSGVYILDKSFEQLEKLSESKQRTDDMNLFENDMSVSPQHYVLIRELRRDYTYLKVQLPEPNVNYVHTITYSQKLSAGVLDKFDIA